MIVYNDPEFEKGFVFKARRLPGAEDVPRTLKDVNMSPYEVSIDCDIVTKGVENILCKRKE